MFGLPEKKSLSGADAASQPDRTCKLNAGIREIILRWMIYRYIEMIPNFLL